MIDFTLLMRSLSIFFAASIITLTLSAQSETHRTEPWITDSQITRVEHSNGYTMLSGSFGSVGVYTGGLVLTDPTSGAAKKNKWPKVNGDVYTMISDGKGGLYVGGYFTSVDTVNVSNLVHINGDSTIDRTWKPNPDDAPVSLFLNGNTLYVSGYFGTIGGQTRNYVASFDVTTGKVNAWNPNPNSYVVTVGATATAVYLGGYFSNVNGIARLGFAAVDPVTAVPTTWNPVVNGAVLSMAFDATSIFIGGTFTTVGGLTRTGVARVTQSSPATTLPFLGNLSSTGFAEDMIVNGNTLYISGKFTTVNGSGRIGLASINITTAAVNAWNPVLPPTATINDMELKGTTLYFSGSFDSVNTIPRDASAAVDATSGVLIAWDPHTPSPPFCLTGTGSGILIGGYFQGVNWLSRANGFALIDDATDKPWPFDFDLNGGVIHTIAVKDKTLYVGGEFTAINKTVRRNLAAFDLATGQLLAWDPLVFGTSPTDRAVAVNSIKIKDNLLYIGGQFLYLNAVSGPTMRSGLAAVDLTSGIVNAWDPLVGNGKTTDQYVNYIDILDKTVYVAGSFALVGGSQARNNLAAVDATSSAVLPWNPDSRGIVDKILVTPTRAYVVGEFFNGVGGKLRNNRFASLVLNADTATNFDPPFNSAVNDIALSGTDLYVAGYYEAIDTLFRPGLASFSLADDSLNAWTPDVGDNGDGGYDVRGISVSPCNKLYVGGNITSFGSEARNNYGEYVITPSAPAIQLVDGTTLMTSAAGSLQWYKNGTAVTGATKSTLEVPDPYEYSVFYVTSTVGGCTVRSIDQEYLITQSELSRNNELMVFPNPVHSELFVQIPTAQGRVTLNMIDIAGRTVKKSEGEGKAHTLQLGDIEVGAYILIIQTDKIRQTRKIIKTR